MNTTFLFVAAIVCILCAAANLWSSIKARAVLKMYKAKLNDISNREVQLAMIKECLDRKADEIKQRASQSAEKSELLYIETSVPNGTKPRVAYKNLASKLGYATLNRYKSGILKKEGETETVYSITLGVKQNTEDRGENQI